MSSYGSQRLNSRHPSWRIAFVRTCYRWGRLYRQPYGHWKLLEAGEDVVVVDRLSIGFDWAVPAETKLIVADIADQDAVESVLKRRRAEAIIHFAGSIIVPDSVSDPLGYYFINTAKSRSLIESAVRQGVPHFIFSSTAAVYRTPEKHP